MNRYVHTIWCDDIRQEVGNKPSFMGVYTGGIVLDRTPTALPKLCAWTIAGCDVNDPLRAVSVSIERDDGEVLVTFPAPEFAPSAAADDESSDKTLRQSMFGVQIGPVQVPDRCRFFVVKVRTDNEILEGNKLWIHTNADQSAQVESSEPPSRSRMKRSSIRRPNMRA